MKKGKSELQTISGGTFLKIKYVLLPVHLDIAVTRKNM